MKVPSKSGSSAPAWVFAMARSAWVSTAAVIEDSLLPGTGSAVVPWTLAVLVRLPAKPLPTARTTVICGAADAASRSVARVHVKVLMTELAGGQVQPTPEADTNVVPVGTGSVTVIVAREVEGPRFDTSSVYVTG